MSNVAGEPLQPWPPWRAGLLACGVLTIALTPWPVGVDGPMSRAVRVGVVVAAVAAMLRRAARGEPELAASMRWIAAALSAAGLGSLIGATWILVTGQVAPIPSLGDAVNLSAAPLALIGLSRLPRPALTLGSPLRTTLDGVLAVGAMLFVAYRYVLVPVFAGEGSTFARVVSLAYPVSAVFVAAIALSLIPRVDIGTRRLLSWMAAGLVLVAVGNSAVAVLRADGTYQPGGWVDVAVTGGLLVMLLGTLVTTGVRPSTQAVSPGLIAVIPLVPVLAAVVVGVIHAMVGSSLRRGEIALAGLVMLSLLARHWLSAREQQELLAELRQQEAHFRVLVTGSSDAITVIDESMRPQYLSPAWGRMFGYGLAELDRESLLALIHPDDVEQVRMVVGAILPTAGASATFECRLRHRGGHWLQTETSVRNLLHEPAVCGLVLNTRDVQDRAVLVRRLAHQASHDALTRLPNRSHFNDHLEKALGQPRQSGSSICVVFLDLDDFKLINDTHGHDAGDLVLQEVATRLASNVREGDLVARLGGDEFAVLAGRPDLAAQQLVDQLLVAVREPIAAGGRTFRVRASAGVVVAGADEDARTLLAHADIAMYEAKAAGKDNSVVLVGADREPAASRLRLREEVAQPQLEQFSLVYQPVVELAGGALYGLEALLRWQHPRVGELPPAQFIALAEQAGSIGRLGRHVLETACAQLAAWRRLPQGGGLHLGVNVSGLQLANSLVGEVTDVLTQYGLAPDALVIEITEAALVNDMDDAVQVLQRLQALGVAVSIDDFGTGYSSMRYLHRFPASSVKIAHEFVVEVTTHPRAAILVRSVVRLAHALGMRVVAEGVERQEQADALRQMGCDLGQGYLFSPPVPAADVTGWLASTSGPPQFAEPGGGSVTSAAWGGYGSSAR